jgi:hypothetical protein
MHLLKAAVLAGALSALSGACGSTETPLDADSRMAIDTLSTQEIRLLRTQLDSQCLQARQTELPRLVDSIKQRRLREIQEQLKSVPQQ